ANRRLTNIQFERVLPRQLRDKPLVLVRLFSAQLVIDMRNRHHDAQLGSQLQQQAKQSHRIRSPGNRRRHAVPGPNRFLPPNCLQQPLRQRVHEEMVPEPVLSSQFSVLGKPLPLRTEHWERLFCYAVPQMWGVSRWTARFLLLVMLAPAYGPMAMACSAQRAVMHCTRQSMSGSMSAHAARHGMQCHQGMAPSKPSHSESSETSFQTANDGNCCPNHCCCGATTSEWAHPASSLLSFVSLLIEPASPAQDAVPQSSDISGHDSARAPPRN